MQLFYNPDIDKHTKELAFGRTESGHIIRVLRKKQGDILEITNGNGLLATAVITIASDKKCIAQVTEIETKKKLNENKLHIAIAPTKSNERFEWFLEKATEIGIDEITPLICDHSERTVYKTERGAKIIEAAAKQSLKYYFPKLHEPMRFDDFLTFAFSGQKFIAHCANDVDKIPLKEALKSTDVLILIGPEGDFSQREITTAKNNGFSAINLGDSRLRTETAGLVAVCTIVLNSS